jgi:hypothetical protein
MRTDMIVLVVVLAIIIYWLCSKTNENYKKNIETYQWTGWIYELLNGVGVRVSYGTPVIKITGVTLPSDFQKEYPKSNISVNDFTHLYYPGGSFIHFKENSPNLQYVNDYINKNKTDRQNAHSISIEYMIL